MTVFGEAAARVGLEAGWRVKLTHAMRGCAFQFTTAAMNVCHVYFGFVRWRIQPDMDVLPGWKICLHCRSLTGRQFDMLVVEFDSEYYAESILIEAERDICVILLSCSKQNATYLFAVVLIEGISLSHSRLRILY